jgi:regulator of replication initiation timing
MRQEPDAENSAGTPSRKPGDLQEIEQDINKLTKRIGSLYDRLNEITQRRIAVIQESRSAQGGETYERMRRRLEAGRAEIDAISEEIERLVAEADMKFELLRAHQDSEGQRRGDASTGTRGKPRDQDRELVRLRRRLGRIADAQNEAVRQWNANPDELERHAFEAKLQRLYEEYSEVLAQLNAARATKVKAGFPN